MIPFHRPYRSWVEIDAARLAANFSAIQSAAGSGAGSGAEVLAVIKADAYGHGAEICAAILARAGARSFGVTDAAEGTRVRRALANAGISSAAGTGSTDQPRIVVMCGSLPEDTPAIAAYGLTPVVWTPEHVRALSGLQQIAIQIEIDTGMGRQGAKPGSELAAILAALRGSSLSVEGLFTHLCSSEIAGSATTELQKQRFEAAVVQVRGFGLQPKFLHIANSSAIDHPGDTKLWLATLAQSIGASPMVRTGLALYGYTLPTATPEAPACLARNLQPVLTWKARILAIHDLAPGDSVGYGASFVAPHAMRVALLPVGYADGLRRELSNPPTHSPARTGGWVVATTPEGTPQRCPILGRISMNLTVVDISSAPHLAPGDAVTLLGPGITAADHARLAHTISYEILCALRPLPHLVVNDPA